MALEEDRGARWEQSGHLKAEWMLLSSDPEGDYCRVQVPESKSQLLLLFRAVGTEISPRSEMYLSGGSISMQRKNLWKDFRVKKDLKLDSEKKKETDLNSLFLLQLQIAGVMNWTEHQKYQSAKKQT